MRIIRRSWEGPFVSIMSKQSRQEYVKAFRAFDSDGGGTIDTGELSEAFHAFGLEYTSKEVIDIVKKYDSVGDFEVTFDDFCEMMEAESKDRKAWFVSSVRVFVPDGGFDLLVLDQNGADHDGLYDRLKGIFVEMDTAASGYIQSVDIGAVCMKLGYRVLPGSVTDLITQFRKVRHCSLSPSFPHKDT